MCVVCIYSASPVSLCIPGREEQTTTLFALGPSGARGCRRGGGAGGQVWGGVEAARQGEGVWGFPTVAPGPLMLWAGLHLGPHVCGPCTQLQRLALAPLSTFLLEAKSPPLER